MLSRLVGAHRALIFVALARPTAVLDERGGYYSRQPAFEAGYSSFATWLGKPGMPSADQMAT